MVLCGSRTADSEFVPVRKSGTEGEKYGNEKDSVVRKWPLPANAVNKTSHYLNASDANKKGRNLYNIFRPPCPIPNFRDPVSCSVFLLPLEGTVRWRVELCCVEGGS